MTPQCDGRGDSIWPPVIPEGAGISALRGLVPRLALHWGESGCLWGNGAVNSPSEMFPALLALPHFMQVLQNLLKDHLGIQVFSFSVQDSNVIKTVTLAELLGKVSKGTWSPRLWIR